MVISSANWSCQHDGQINDKGRMVDSVLDDKVQNVDEDMEGNLSD